LPSPGASSRSSETIAGIGKVFPMCIRAARRRLNSTQLQQGAAQVGAPQLGAGAQQAGAGAQLEEQPLPQLLPPRPQSFLNQPNIPPPPLPQPLPQLEAGAQQAFGAGAQQAGSQGAAQAGSQAGPQGAAQVGPHGSQGAAQAGSQAGPQGAAQAGSQAGPHGAAQAGSHGAQHAGAAGAQQAGSQGAAQTGSHGAAQVGSHGAQQLAGAQLLPPWPKRPALAELALTAIARAAIKVVHFILRFSLTLSGIEREELRIRTASEVTPGVATRATKRPSG
jgi:hypothetical protein